MKAALFVLISSATASAAPCTVDVVRAPEGVREVIDHWVAAEPQCAAALEVRIVATKQGLYVLARDRGGRVRDRVVPDAATAGVLIASWAADASVPGVPASIATPPVAPTPIVAIATPIRSAGVGAEVDASPLPLERQPSERRWIRVTADEGLASAMLSPGPRDGGALHSDGVRGWAGVWTRDAWTLDVSADYVSSRPSPYRIATVHEVNAFANLGYVLHRGFWSLTPSVGLGLRYAMLDDAGNPVLAADHERNVMPVAQGSLLGGYGITDRIQLVFGMSAVLYPDIYDIGENVELEWLGGVGVAM